MMVYYNPHGVVHHPLYDPTNEGFDHCSFENPHVSL